MEQKAQLKNNFIILIIINFNSLKPVVFLLYFLLFSSSLFSQSTPIQIAASKGDIETVKQLLKQGVDVDEKIELNESELSPDTFMLYNWTPLLYAADSKQLEIIKLLIKNGADINAKGCVAYVNELYGNIEKECNFSFLNIVLRSNDNDFIKNILFKIYDSNLNLTYNQRNDILYNLIKLKDTSLLNKYLPTNENLNDFYIEGEYDDEFMNIIELAIIYGDSSLINYLINKGATLTNTKDLLFLACENNNIQTAKYIIEHPGDESLNGLINSINYTYYKTPLHIASLYGFKELVELLISYGANVNAKANNRDFGAEIGKSQDTPLHLACENNYPEIVKILIENGSDTTIPNSIGRTPCELTDSEEIKKMVCKK